MNLEQQEATIAEQKIQQEVSLRMECLRLADGRVRTAMGSSEHGVDEVVDMAIRFYEFVTYPYNK